jgi:rod shape-determining protein MreC
MKPIFNRGPSLESRLMIVVVLSLALLVSDGLYGLFTPVRSVLTTLVSPIQYIASVPASLLNASSNRIISQEQLIEENDLLIQQMMALQADNQRYQSLLAENEQLRKLLDAPVQTAQPKTVAELMAVDNNPYSLQVLINKGSLSGVYNSQPVIDDQGIVGQIVDVAQTTSRVLLVSDLSHAIPVRILRNNLRLIANGSGELNALNVRHVAHSADIAKGDILVTSGLGNIYPEGYPVAIIATVVRDEGQPFATVTATPLARLDRLRYLLLLGRVNSPLESANE